MAKADSSGLKPYLTFEQLVISPHNEVAAGACQAVVKKPGGTYNPLFLYGPAGVGKTHLLQAVANELLKIDPNTKLRYLSAERFMSEVVAAVSEDRLLDLRRRFSDLDLFVLDDIQYLGESKISQDELFHIFNNMTDESRQVVIAADRAPNQLTALGANVCSRLEWGLVTDIKAPDTKTRVEILRKKQKLQDIALSEEMLVFAAESLSANVRELEGFLKRIHAYTTLSHQELTMALVQSVIREIVPAAGTGPVQPALPPAPPIVSVSLNGSSKENGAQPSENGKTAPPAENPPPQKEAAVPAAAKPAPAKGSLEALLKEVTKPKEEPPPAPAVAAPAAPAPAEETSSEEKTLVSPAETIPDYSETEDLPAGHKEVGAVFFYPEKYEDALETVHRKFQEVIKKHKLKFRLKKVHGEPYTFKGKINYTSFVDVCKANRVPVAIVIGPPPENFLPEQDFYDLLTVTLDVQGVSLQLVNWGEINKDYRYLNLALDIALVRSR